MKAQRHCKKCAIVWILNLKTKKVFMILVVIRSIVNGNARNLQVMLTFSFLFDCVN